MLGNTVREYRIRLGLSQEDLAHAAGVDVKTIGNIEAGRTRPRPSTLRLLVHALHLDPTQQRRLQALVLDATDGRPDDPVPAQLPADVAAFAGRDEPLRRLDALLEEGAGEAVTAVVISAVSGTAGVGKTALAVHWAHRVADRFSDGLLYVNLRGFDPGGQPMACGEAVRRFLAALGVPPQRVPADLDAQAALYRSLLARRRMLIVLDNARDTAQVRPLLPGTPGCLVVVTSRSQLTGLIVAHGARPITLDLLTADESRHLLARRLGADRMAAEPEAVEEIVTRCARLPLALTLVAGYAATRPGAALHTLAEELRDTQYRWRALAAGDGGTDVRAVFSWSYRTLTPDAARLFRLLGVHPGPDITVAAAASLAALTPARAWPLLAELTRINLLIEHTPGRYTLHDLLRAYATHLTRTRDPQQHRNAATRRILGHYLHTASTADAVLDPARDRIALAAREPGVTPEHPADHQHALDWFTAEHAVLLSAVGHAATTGFDSHAWQLAWALWTFLDRRGHWSDLAAIGRVAVDAAERGADPPVRALAHRLLATAYLRLARLQDANTELERALELYTVAGDQIGQARSHLSLGYLANRRDEPARALDHARQGLDLYQAAGHQFGQAEALNNAGWYHARLGDHRQALVACQQALALHREHDNHYGQANALDSLGYAHHHLGDHPQALTCYEQALALYRQLGHRYNEAIILVHLGDAHHAAGQAGAARDAYRQALTIFTDLDHPDADTARTKLQSVSS